MSQNAKKKITASLVLLSGIMLAEYLHYTNSKEKPFELSSINDPRALPLWLIENTVSYIGHSLPRPMVLALKAIIPLICLYIIIDSDNPTNSIGNNRHALFNSEYSPYLKSYIARMKQHESFASQLARFVLTEEEKEKLEEFDDCISGELMEIPVSLYGKNYNLNTLLSLEPKRDPHTRISFTLRDIQAMPEIAEKIRTLIKEFHQARAQPPQIS